MNNVPLLNFERNESVYSLLARLHRITGCTNPLRTLNLVLGVRGYKPLSGLPTHLARLVVSLLQTKSVAEIIGSHTHYPLYEPFISTHKRASILEAMNGAGATKSILGLLRNHVGASEALRYCEICVAEECTKYGFPYWHREHLLPWIYLCPHHLQPLKFIDLDLLDYHERALVLPEKGKYLRHPKSGSSINKLINFSVDTFTLLNRGFNSEITINGIVYYRILKEIGLASKGGHINQRHLCQSVKQWLRDIESLPPFDCLMDSIWVERSWVANVASDNKRFHHPLKHLVMLQSLGLTLDELLLSTKPYVQEELVFERSKSPKLSDEEIRVAIYEEKSIRKAASRLRVDVTTLCCAANRLKIDYTHRTKYITDEVINDVIHEAVKGHSSAKIATRFDLSVSSVNRIKRSYLF